MPNPTSADPVYIVSGARTPVGSFNGALASVSAPELGGVAIKAALQRANLGDTLPKEVYMGCVLTAGLGQAPARQALFKAGLPESVGATTVGKVCGSGMKSLLLARLEIMAGEADCVVAGGMENMSQAPFLLKGAREGLRLGHQQLLDSMVFDGLWDPYENIHMGNCAEQCVEKYNFSREDQDAYAIESYKRALAAQAAGDFAEEIVPVPVAQRKGDPLMVDTDEEPQRTVLDKIPSLRPAFDKNGTITAANTSSINDGAAALVVASQKLVQENALKPLAKIVATATFSQTPMWFTTAPVEAIKAVVDKAGLGLGDIDAFEINEAFAAVPMAAMADLKLDHAKVNCRGSGVSLGHPIGASGARIVVTLAHLLKQKNLQYGLATLCIGGGEATAVILENVAS